MRIFSFIAAVALTATAATAREEICTFTQECFEDEDCVVTDFSVNLKYAVHEPQNVVIDTPADRLHGQEYVRGNMAQIFFRSETALHLISSDIETKAVRYSVHMQGPLAITYLGTCEETQ